MHEDTTCAGPADPAGAVFPPSADNLQPFAPDSRPAFTRHSGGTLRAFGAFMAFFQPEAAGSASANSPVCGVTLSRISDLGVRRCILVCFGDLRPLAWVSQRRIKRCPEVPAVQHCRQKRSVALFSANVIGKTFCVAGAASVGCPEACKNLTAGTNASPRSRNGQVLSEPTSQPRHPRRQMKKCKRWDSFSACVTLNIPQLAHLVLFSRSTQGHGLAGLFQPSAPGSHSVRNVTAPTMFIQLIHFRLPRFPPLR
jgi:hypothetical protein